MLINELFKRSFADVGQYDDYARGMPIRICYDLYKEFEAKRINYDNADFYIISEATDVDRIVRLATLMPSTVTFTNLNNTVVQSIIQTQPITSNILMEKPNGQKSTRSNILMLL